MEYNEPLIIDPTYGTGLRVYQKITPTLRSHRFGLSVLVTPKSTSTQLKYTKGTSMADGIKVGENNPLRNGNRLPNLSYTLKASTARHIILEDTKTMETQQQSKLKNCPTSTYLSEDSLARHLALLESELDLTTPEGHSFLTSQGFSKKNNHDIWYSKTSKVYLVTTKVALSRQSLGFSPTWGIAWNGRYLTAKTSEFPKTESGCSLSDILEENVPDKYFLSEVQTKKILASSGESMATLTPDARIRRLTPLECERLMSWPDNWTIGSDTQRYKQCGNGVVSNCVQAVIEELKPCLL